MIGSKRCGRKYDGQILSNFYIEENSFHRKNIKGPEKGSIGKFWQICFVLTSTLKAFILILIYKCWCRTKQQSFIYLYQKNKQKNPLNYTTVPQGAKRSISLQNCLLFNQPINQ